MNLRNTSRFVILVSFLLIISLSVYASSLSITIESPDRYIRSNNVEFKISTNMNASCTLEVNNSTYTSTTNKREHVWQESLTANNNYNMLVYCENYADNTINNTKQKTFTIDTLPPEILSHSPEDANQKSIELIITTNEESTCRYSLSQNTDFYDMGNIFDITGYKTHKTRLNFEKDQIFNAYIRCVDLAGNVNNKDYRVTIFVDIPPTARIAMDESSPIRAGTVLVRLITSEPLIGLPQLRYTLQDSQGRTENFNIPLSGSGQFWEGYMIISESGGKRVGSFQFEGMDYGGNVGSAITSGGTFIVDSVNPSRIEELKATAQPNGRIKLDWKYNDPRDVDRYEIYRSKTPGVTLLDFHDYTYEDGYIDYGLPDNTVYYYRVVAIDKAGNRGTLSREVDARSTNVEIVRETYDRDSSQQTQTSPSQSSSLSSNLMPILTDSIRKYSGMKKLVDDLVLYYRSQSNIDERILSDLGIQNQISSAKGKVYSFMNEFEDLKKEDLSEDVLRNRIRSIELKLESVKSEIPTSITKTNSYEISSNPSLQNVMNAFDGLMNLLRIVNLDESIRQDFVDESLKLNQQFSIEGTADILSISYYDGTENEVLLINKEIKQPSDRIIEEQGLMLVEDINEIIADNVNKINFISRRPEILKQSTMVKWNLNEINGEIKYYIEGDFRNFNENDLTTTILDNYRIYFDELGRKAGSESSNFITGMAIFNFSESENIRNIFGLILGIIAVAGLGIYYFTMDSENSNIIEKIKEKTSEISNKKKIKENIKNNDGNKFKEIFDEMSLNNSLPKIEEQLNLNQSYNYSEKINSAEEKVNNLKFNDASNIYIQTLEELKNETDDNKKYEVINDLKKLYNKLNLYQNIIYFQQALSKSDYNNMEKQIKTISEIYNNLRSLNQNDNQLMSLARETYHKYNQYLSDKKFMPKY